MQSIGVTNKEYFGMLWYFLQWSILLCGFNSFLESTLSSVPVERKSVTSRYRGSNIFESQQFFLAETAICIVQRWNETMGYPIRFPEAAILLVSERDRDKATRTLRTGLWAIVLFLSAIMCRKVLHVIFFCYHGKVT